ncbi:hypothetical protein CBL_12223 [Carabus blaptoides fortunei]
MLLVPPHPYVPSTSDIKIDRSSSSSADQFTFRTFGKINIITLYRERFID